MNSLKNNLTSAPWHNKEKQNEHTGYKAMYANMSWIRRIVVQLDFINILRLKPVLTSKIAEELKISFFCEVFPNFKFENENQKKSKQINDYLIQPSPSPEKNYVKAYIAAIKSHTGKASLVSAKELDHVFGKYEKIDTTINKFSQKEGKISLKEATTIAETYIEMEDYDGLKTFLGKDFVPQKELLNHLVKKTDKFEVLLIAAEYKCSAAALKLGLYYKEKANNPYYSSTSKWVWENRQKSLNYLKQAVETAEPQDAEAVELRFEKSFSEAKKDLHFINEGIRCKQKKGHTYSQEELNYLANQDKFLNKILNSKDGEKTDKQVTESIVNLVNSRNGEFKTLLRKLFLFHPQISPKVVAEQLGYSDQELNYPPSEAMRVVGEKCIIFAQNTPSPDLLTDKNVFLCDIHLQYIFMKHYCGLSGQFSDNEIVASLKIINGDELNEAPSQTRQSAVDLSNNSKVEDDKDEVLAKKEEGEEQLKSEPVSPQGLAKALIGKLECKEAISKQELDDLDKALDNLKEEDIAEGIQYSLIDADEEHWKSFVLAHKNDDRLQGNILEQYLWFKKNAHEAFAAAYKLAGDDLSKILYVLREIGM